MTDPALATETQPAVRFILSGRVQGLGVRPAIARLATQLGLTGHVSNQSNGVCVHVEGDAATLHQFQRQLPDALPIAAELKQLTRAEVAATGCPTFKIDTGSPAGALATEVPCDLPVCDDCLREIAARSDRRHGYAFTSCTNCGPRYSIIDRMPYERDDTAMREFRLCPECEAEFTSPDNRRFHAQTNACPDCGPVLAVVTPAAPHPPTETAPLRSRSEQQLSAIKQVAAVVRDGGIVALKGLGGYQLVCDATSTSAVAELRRRKRRPAKPLAVMLDVMAADLLTTDDRAAFLAASNPIVVLSPDSSARLRTSFPPRADDACAETPDEFHCLTQDNLAPGMNTLGVFRPTTPLHSLLLEAVGWPLVVTSGNAEGDPLAFEDAAAQRDLAPLSDLILPHDRNIERPIDDSVVRVIAGRPVTIRAARGIAPLPLNFRTTDIPVRREARDDQRTGMSVVRNSSLLAVGGHQKAAVALSNRRQSVLGPHIGDLDSIATRNRFDEQTRELLNLYQAEPGAIVCDLHPDYFTTRWAEQQADERGVPLIRVQHHHAHIAAGMLEHGWLDRTVLGVAFDGTGYGTDDTIWGGEFLLSTATHFERVASLRPFVLPGGEQAIRQPWRVAVSLLSQAFDDDGPVPLLNLRESSELVAATFRLARRRVGPQCSSMGRLFDGVAAIVLGIGEAQFEGELAMRLEAACDSAADGSFDLPVDDTADIPQLDWRPLIRQLCDDCRSGTPVGAMAMKFHRSIAAAVESVADRFEHFPVVLGGGCFQNRILTELIAEGLTRRIQPVGLPGMIPPNDGGLAAGQLAVGRARLSQPTEAEMNMQEDQSCA